LILALSVSACSFQPATPPESTPPTEESSVPTEPTEPSVPPTSEKRVGWYDQDGDTYYYNEDGVMTVGWLELNEDRYYFREDGRMAKGMVTIDGKPCFFTSTGAPIYLVNPWHFLPEDYSPDLVELPGSISTSGQKVDRSCYDALLQMITDCNKECPKACVVSSYRTQEYQQGLFQKKINFYLNQGYNREDAERLAATVIAIPGTSEHQLGLAVDIIDTRSWNLNEGQAELPAQQWLMANCWKYGFILRFPADKTDITGIIYEPWHYRYVGKDVAKELYEAGLTLEEYITNLTQE
jgi:LAS superfamily LD-carboxypeptidase LdcB